MYAPQHFRLDDAALQRDLVQANPLALLVAADGQDLGPNAVPLALHLPMVWHERDGQSCFEGHLARGNPHLRSLREGQTVRLVFTGPDAYVSPTHYADRQSVPTWNYLALEVKGVLHWVDEAHDKDALLKRLIAIRDPDYVAQWRGLDPSYQSRMLSAIIGIRVQAQTLEAKAKLSQNRPAEDRERLRAYLDAGANPTMADWMRRLGL